MVYQLVNLRINRIVAHQVFQRTVTGEMVEPKCSQERTVLDQPGLTALQIRITEALGNNSHYYLIQKQRENLKRRWPLPKADIQPLFADLGISMDAAVM